MKKYYSPRTGACLLIFLGQDPFVQDVSLIARSKQVLKGSLVSLLGGIMSLIESLAFQCAKDSIKKTICVL